MSKPPSARGRPVGVPFRFFYPSAPARAQPPSGPVTTRRHRALHLLEQPTERARGLPWRRPRLVSLIRSQDDVRARPIGSQGDDQQRQAGYRRPHETSRGGGAGAGGALGRLAHRAGARRLGPIRDLGPPAVQGRRRHPRSAPGQCGAVAADHAAACLATTRPTGGGGHRCSGERRAGGVLRPLQPALHAAVAGRSHRPVLGRRARRAARRPAGWRAGGSRDPGDRRQAPGRGRTKPWRGHERMGAVRGRLAVGSLPAQLAAQGPTARGASRSARARPGGTGPRRGRPGTLADRA